MLEIYLYKVEKIDTNDEVLDIGRANLYRHYINDFDEPLKPDEVDSKHYKMMTNFDVNDVNLEMVDKYKDVYDNSLSDLKPFLELSSDNDSVHRFLVENSLEHNDRGLYKNQVNRIFTIHPSTLKVLFDKCQKQLSGEDVGFGDEKASNLTKTVVALENLFKQDNWEDCFYLYFAKNEE